MAVPSSGTLNISALAAEKLENDYTDVDTSYGPYSLKDITLGGASTVNGEDYDATNTNSTTKPDSVAPHAMSEWFGYDHDASASTGKCLLIIDTTFLTPGTQTGCSSATAIAGATGAIMTGATNTLDYHSRFGRYRNTSSSSVNYTIRVYRQYSNHCELKIYKGTQTSTTGYTLINQTLVHTHTTTGYQTFTGTLNSGSDLTIYFGSTPNANATRTASFDQFYVSGSSCSYNGTMYAIPILGSATSSSSNFHFTNWIAATSAGANQRYNQSAWSTAYIHQCAGSTWTIGNNIFTTNSASGNQVAYYQTGWRVFANPNSSWSPGNAPGSSSINAVYDSGVYSYNMEQVRWGYEAEV